jgi:hypothetical protein
MRIPVQRAREFWLLTVFLQQSFVTLAKLGNFGPNDRHAVGVSRVVCKVVLMIVLGRIEDLHFFKRCHNGIIEIARFVEFGDGFRSQVFLFRVVVEDG